MMKKLAFAQLGDVFKGGFNLVLAYPVMLVPAAISVWLQTFLFNRLAIHPGTTVVWSEFIPNFGLVLLASSFWAVVFIKMSFDGLAGKVNVAMALTVAVKKFLPAFGALLLCSVAVFLGSILFVVPGIIIGVRLVFVLFLIVLEGYGATEALSVAWKMTAYRWWWVFALIMLGALLFALTGATVLLLPVGVQGVAQYALAALATCLQASFATRAFVLLRELDAQ